MKRADGSRDQTTRCTECGTEFLYTAGEQRARADAGEVGLPALCPGCRVLERLTQELHEESQGDTPVESGTVKWYDRRKGFGFLAGDGGEQFFFHRSSLPRRKRTPRRGDVVHFTRKQGTRGLEATGIRLAGRRQSQRTGKKPAASKAPAASRMPAEKAEGANGHS